MKLLPLLVAGSIAANAALLAFYLSRSSPDASTGTTGLTATATHGSSGAAGTGAKQGTATAAGGAGEGAASGKIWSALSTGDLQALVARMRAAGFPASVIRSVVWQQVNENFKARRTALAPSIEDQPFWKTRGDIFGGYDQKYYAALRELNREQSKLVKEILGADATPPEASPAMQRRYGNLTSEQIEQVQRLDQDYNELRNEVNAASRGIMLPEDREKLAMLEKERRADLAQLLNPQELEDYLMRTSQTTTRLRTALTTLNASEAEFRAIYQAQLAFDEKYTNANMGVGMVINTADSMRERQAAQAQVNEQIKAALGDQRYAEYVRASDREYQQLNRLAQQSNLPTSAANQVYDFRNNAVKESSRIFDDPSLNADQKRAALQTLGQNTRSQITATLGADVGERYLQVATRWIGGLERGAALNLTDNGTIAIRNLPQPRPNPPSTTGANPGAPASGAPIPR